MDYRQLLRDDLQTRKMENSHYGMRAFAADVGVSAAYISLILNGQRKLSEDRACDIAKNLGWDPYKQKYFCTLVRYENATAAATRDAIKEELEQFSNREDGYDDVKVDVFRMISKWYHAALIELTRLPDFEAHAVWIARRLGITPIEADLALDRLVRLGLLSRSDDGKCQRKVPKLEVQDIPSKAIRAHHQDVLNQAMQSLENQDMDSRTFGGLTLAIDSAKLPEAKRILKENLKEIADLLNTGERDAVYQVSYQMFRLDRPPVYNP